MTPEEKVALAKRLRAWAVEYTPLIGRAHAISQLVADLQAAADELDPPV